MKIPSDATHLGSHLPQALHHPHLRTSGLVGPDSTTSQSLDRPSTVQTPYYSPHSSAPAYYHPSPYSTNSAAGSYASSEPGDNMAAQAALGRQQYPPISSYQTPQSNSPASITSPQTDHHGRPMYSMPSMSQSLYYQPQYMHPGAYPQHHLPSQQPPQHQQQPQQHQQQQQQQQPQHHHHQPHHHQHHQQQQPQQQHQAHHQQPQQPQQQPQAAHQHQQPQPQQRHGHHTQMSPVQGMLMSQPVQPHHQLHQPHPHHSPHLASQQAQANAYESKPAPTALQQQQQQQQQQHHSQTSGAQPQTPSTASATTTGGQPQSAAPGPIPATTPLVVRQDMNGVQWIAFEYSRDRVKMEYTIRCDVESVDVNTLSDEFKNSNCVYPRACCAKEQYKGNRLAYESECNAVGWALAQLNPPLREKRGLIQRAVDSWRNSNQDMRLRSRRVRRIAKMNTRKQNGGAPVGPSAGNTGHLASGTGHGLALKNDFTSPTDGMPVGADYGTAPPSHHHQQPPMNGHPGLATPTTQHTPRYAQNFYPTHPQAPLGSQHHGIDGVPMRPPGTTLSAKLKPASTRSPVVRQGDDEDDQERQSALFGDVPESRKRKFILVDDGQRNQRVRVRVTLDKVKLDDMPDAHLRLNAVYPRSYFPRQTGSPRMKWDDEDDGRGTVATTVAAADGGNGEVGAADDRPAALGKTLVYVPVMEGGETQLPVPRMSTSRRGREVALNELGCRMAWGQARTFSGRTLFLQRSLDAYRTKTRDAMLSSGRSPESIAAHFETRAGKRKLSIARGRWTKRASWA